MSKKAKSGGIKTATLGQEIIGGLAELRDAIKHKEKLSKRFTVRAIELELEPHEYQPADILNVRQSLGVSQALFAKLLAVSPESVEGWEQGVRVPSPSTRRLLDFIRISPQSWIDMLSDSVRENQPA